MLPPSPNENKPCTHACDLYKHLFYFLHKVNVTSNDAFIFKIKIDREKYTMCEGIHHVCSEMRVVAGTTKTSSVIRQGLSRDPHSVDASGQVSVLGPMSSLVKVEFWPQYRLTDESCSQILGVGWVWA